MFSEGYNGDFGWNVLIVLVVTVGMYLYLSKSKHGYEIAVIGDSENTARYAGIRVSRVYVRTMLVSGAICGLAGFIAVSGAAPHHLHHRLRRPAASPPSSWRGSRSSTASSWSSSPSC